MDIQINTIEEWKAFLQEQRERVETLGSLFAQEKLNDIIETAEPIVDVAFARRDAGDDLFASSDTTINGNAKIIEAFTSMLLRKIPDITELS